MTCFDRNFPGYDLVTAILLAGGHVIARVKEGISLPFADGPGRGWLPDGSRMSWLNAPSGKKADRLPVRVAEHNVTVPGPDGKEQVSETCTIITTLLDHEAVPADQVREAYLTRWSASETTFGEDKATIAGAGNRTSGPVLRSGRPRLVIQEAWAWLTGTQLVRASEAAALRSGHAAARALRRRNAGPGHRRRGILHRRPAPRHPVHGQPPRSRPPHRWRRLAAAADAAARAALHTLNLPGRQRHSERKQKARPKFGHATATKTDLHRETPGHRLRTRLLLSQRPGPGGRKEGTAPPTRGRGPWNRAPYPPRHAGRSHARAPAPGNRHNGHTRNIGTTSPQKNPNT